MNDLNEDMLDVLEMREKQLTEMIRMLQKKRRNVREFIARYNAKDLKPVPNSVPVAESAVAKAEEVSGGNNPDPSCVQDPARGYHFQGCPHSLPKTF